MKKTLALALVAAMTISMASMTAFAKNLYSPEDDKKIPEEVTARVELTEKEFKDKGGVVAEGTTSYKLAANKSINEGTVAQDNATDAPVALNAAILKVLDGTRLQELVDNGTIIKETIDGDATIKFEKLGLKTFENTATKTFFGWKDGTYQASSTCDWKTNVDPTSTVHKDSDTITLTKGTKEVDGVTFVIYTKDFATVGRIDTDDKQIAKNLENIEKAKKDKEKAEADKKDLEKWDEEHNATNNVLKRGDDGKDVLDTAQARVTPMGTKWDNKVADYMGHDDYCRHAAQVIGLGDDAGDIYDIYAVESPSDPEKGIGFLKGKSARITLAPISIKNPSDFDITVYHVEGWCKAKKVKDFKIVDNKIVLWGDSFSPYVVVYNTKGASSTGSDASNPSTGDFSAVPVALLAAAALGATGFVAYKKRKAE